MITRFIVLAYQVFLEPITTSTSPHHHPARADGGGEDAFAHRRAVTESSSLAIRALFFLYYQPIFVVALLLQANALINVCIYQFMLPLLVSKSKRMTELGYGELGLLAMLQKWMSLGCDFLPEIAVFFVVLTLMNKILAIIVEAIVDTVSRSPVLSRDVETGKRVLRDTEYPLLMAQVKWIVSTRSRAGAALVVLAIVTSVFFYFLFFFLDILSTRDSIVLVAAATTFLASGAFLAGGALFVWRRQKQQQATVSSEQLDLNAQPAPTSPAVAVAKAFLNTAPLREAADDLAWLHDKVPVMLPAIPRALSETATDMFSALEATLGSGTGGASSPTTAVSSPPRSQQRLQPQQRFGESNVIEALSSFARAFDFDAWWARCVNNLRLVALLLIAGWTLTVAAWYGPVYSVRFAIELLVVCNMPNLWLMVFTSVTMSICRFAEDVRWIFVDQADMKPAAFLLCMPHLMLLLWASVQSSRHAEDQALFLLVIPFGIVAVVARALFLCRLDTLKHRVVWSSMQISHQNSDMQQQRQRGHTAAWSPISLQRALALERAICAGDTTVSHGDMEANVKTMRMVRINNVQNSSLRHSGSTAFLLKRVCASTPGVDTFVTTLRLLPSLLLLRTKGMSDLARGQRFSLARGVLRLLNFALAGVLSLLIVLVVAQETFSVLRPLPVQLKCDGASCEINHQHLIKMLIRLRDEKQSSATVTATSAATLSDKYPDAADHGHGAICHYAPIPETPDVTLFELGLLSLPPYLASSSDTIQFVNFVNRALRKNSSNAWTVLRPGSTRRAGELWSSYMTLSRPLINNNNNRTLLLHSVRGTDAMDMLDALEDVRLFAPAVLFHLMQQLVPLLNWLPNQIVQDTLWLTGFRAGAGRGAEFHYSAVTKKYFEEQERNLDIAQGDLHVGIGHSLGGSLVKIGATAKMRTVTFSAPGTLYSARLFNLTRPSAPSTNVFLLNDVVPFIGGSVSSSIRANCLVDRERCHALESILHSIFHTCANVRKGTVIEELDVK